MAGLTPTPEVTLWVIRGESATIHLRFSAVPAAATESYTVTFVARLRQNDSLAPYITKTLPWIEPDANHPTEGLALLKLTPAETAALPPTDCVYYVNLTRGADVDPVFRGTLKVED